MKNINIRQFWYKAKHDYLTLNNGVIVIAVVISLSWIWGSISVMQRNYELQRKLDAKNRQLQLVKLEVELAEYQKRYRESNEYKELAAREYLGLANPGEGVMILPPNSEAVRKAVAERKADNTTALPRLSNFEQWLRFLMGNK